MLRSCFLSINWKHNVCYRKMPEAKCDSRYQSKGENKALDAHCMNSLSVKVNAQKETAVVFVVVLLTRRSPFI